MNENQRKASKFLLRHSSLSNNPNIDKVVNFDLCEIHFENIDVYQWSETETVLLGVLKTISNRTTGIPLSGLLVLDEHDRQACIDAIRISFFGLDPLLHEVG